MAQLVKIRCTSARLETLLFIPQWLLLERKEWVSSPISLFADTPVL